MVMTTHTSPTAEAISCRLGAWGALSTLVGILLSGPLAILWLEKTHPQPAWRGAETFAQSYHGAQSLPYFAGFFLVGGYVVLMSSLHALASAEQKAIATTSLVFTAAFATLVFLNYLIQTTFIPSLARNYARENAAVIAAFTMANPASLGWAIEMWAWGFLGVATWIMAPAFSGSRLERFTAWAFVANGVSSVASAIWTVLEPAWVMTTLGLVCFASWNTLVFVMSALAFVALRRRRTAHAL
jgi:hypothetical protein